MLLDEATTGYDMESRKVSMKELFPNQTVIVVTHHQEELEGMDTIYRLHQGEIEKLNRGGNDVSEKEKLIKHIQIASGILTIPPLFFMKFRAPGESLYWSGMIIRMFNEEEFHPEYIIFILVSLYVFASVIRTTFILRGKTRVVRISSRDQYGFVWRASCSTY